MVKKIDFHIHTIPSIKDSQFEFSMDWLKRYVNEAKLDAIAITNHDLFDNSNFKEISNHLKGIDVYPGIELTLDIGHVNIVFPKEDANNLESFSNKLKDIHTTQNDCITSADLCNMLSCWRNGIYIFDLGKSKDVKHIPTELKDVVSVGGVSNQFKFHVIKNNLEKLTPCLFSDAHATEQESNSRNDIEKLKDKNTYLQLDSCRFEDIKNCLKDRNKISITRENLKDVNEVNGVKLSTGLNLVVGKRGTGKTHFLNEIKDRYDTKDYYEIKQFETSRAEEYIEKQRKEQGRIVLQEWKDKYKQKFEVITTYLKKDNLDEGSSKIDDYLKSVKASARSSARSLSGNKYKLFKEARFETPTLSYIHDSLNNIKNVIDKKEIWTLLDNGNEKKILFINVYMELRKKYIDLLLQNKLKEKINSIKRGIDTIVSNKTGLQTPNHISLNEIIFNKQLELRINQFLKTIIISSQQKNEKIHGYQISVNLTPYENAQQFRQEIGTKDAVYSDLMVAYKKGNFIPFLKTLKTKSFYNEANFAEYLIRKEVKLLDSDGIPASGGQAVGFALMLRLNEAKNKDVILIDEPESSLDNAYIENELNPALRNLAKNSMVVVVTHNSTLGALLKPDYLVATSKNDKGQYSIMSGEFSSTRITNSLNGEEESSYNKFVEAMESSIKSYNEKGKTYENLKD